MRYKSFRIQNFKGVKDAVVDLSSMTGANVFALVGLNESGKTTVLEAIHSFSPDFRSARITGKVGPTPEQKYQSRVPRHLISTFTGCISVCATIELTTSDKAELIRWVQKNYQEDLKIDLESVPDTITMERAQSFERGDFKGSLFKVDGDFRVKSGKQRTWRQPSSVEREHIRSAVYDMSPDIAYYPTFIFDFPDRIYLTNRGTPTSRFYKEVFQDILAYDGRGHTIDDIVRRVRSDDLVLPWTQFLSLWSVHTDKAKIQHVIDRAEAAVTKLVFGRWNKIFKEDVKGKEVIITYNVVEGEVKDKAGNITFTNNHDVYVMFQIKDGTRRFNVNDRSLGFRWFFAFLLFTQFRVARQHENPVLFLFDEPASNLHAAAQQKLIESFPEIARDRNMLLYTTHSHYMIEPKWLEQTFIVTNRSDTPDRSVIDTAALDDESLDIKVERYRAFANAHPNQTSYFQPVIDRLQVVPSRFDYNVPSAVLEGKSDYYIIRYASDLLKLDTVRLIPGLGAGTFEALIALGAGWGIRFLFLLDGDSKGKEEAERYALELGAPVNSLVTLDELHPEIRVIEDLLDEEAVDVISKRIDAKGCLTKNQIRRFFQEQLAKGEVINLGSKFERNARALLLALNERFSLVQ